MSHLPQEGQKPQIHPQQAVGDAQAFLLDGISESFSAREISAQPFPARPCPLSSDMEQKETPAQLLEGKKPEFCEKLESIGHIKRELLWGPLCKSAAEQ